MTAETKKNEIRINRLPALTWHRLRANDAGVSLPESAVRASCRMEGDISSGTDSFPELKTGAGEAFREWVRQTGIEPVRITAAADGEQTVRLHIEAKADSAPSGQAFVLPVEIEAGRGQRLTVVMDLKDPDPETAKVLAVQTRIRAAGHAFVKLVQLQLTGEKTTVYADTGAAADEGAQIETVQLFLGGADTFAGSEIDLRGDNSSLRSYTAYLGSKTKKLDLNYNAVHNGRDTESSMKFNGVLRDSAEKTFRGTIDFRTGSSGAVGAETEDVLLLGEGAVNKTIPLILCAEEDVQGSHGATIGQLDEEMLFYLGSRGIPEEKAVDLMAGARIGSIIREIRDEQAEELAEAFLGITPEEY